MTVEKKNEFRVNLLGPWQVTKNNEPLTDFRGDSVRALFTYLIVEHSSPQSRRFLASFLWEELEEEAAMRNVRVSLTRLRKGLGDDADNKPLLYVDRQSVGIAPDTNYILDTEQFEQAIAHGRRSIEPGRSPDRRVLARLKRAVDLYRADFLQGFTHPSVPFEEWMMVRRERFHGDALWALHVLADHALRIQDWHTAVDYAQRQINLEAWSEEGFQQLIQAQIELGQRSAALASFERCKQVLWDELGVEPDEETKKLYQQARDGDTNLAEEKPVPHNLPTAGSNFFSREAEIDFLLNRMADPDGRLTTILGEGGVGKSRLSQYVGRRLLRDFKDGVWFIPLDHIESEEQAKSTEGREESEIIRLMIDTLGVPLAGNRPDRDQLLGWLARKEILLILDNYEHVISAAELVNEILETAAEAAVIVTSRIPLNLRQETLLPLDGLSLDGVEPAQAPAVRLFFDRADRAGAAYEMDEVTIQAVANTCEQVGGNALAIELAAVWMRQMTAGEIEAEVRQSIDFLGTTHRDMPERHRSMRAVFDQTWKLLDPKAQQTFAKLSVFIGGFSAAAAIDVVKTDRQMLGLLQDRSLINRLASGRFAIRPLLRQYASSHFSRFGMLGIVRQFADEKLQENGDDSAEVQQAHAAWFLTFMADQRADLMGAKPWDAIERIELDIENVRAGWQTAVSGKQADLLQKAAEPLSEYYNIRGRFQEALDMFTQAADAANGQWGTYNGEWTMEERTDKPTNQQTDKLVAHATMHKTRFLVRLGKYKEGVEQGKLAVGLAKRTKDAWCAAMGHVWWCQAFWEQGLTKEALDVLKKGGRFREKARDRYLDGRFSHQYSVCYSIKGDLELALQKSSEAIDIFSSLETLYHKAISLNSYASILHQEGDFEKAKSTLEKIITIVEDEFMLDFTARIYSNLSFTQQKLFNYSISESLLEKVLGIYKDMGLDSRIPLVYGNMASLSFDRKKFNTATEFANKALNLAKKFNHSHIETSSIITLGNVSLEKREYKVALQYYLHAAEISDQNQFQQKKVEILFGIAQCFVGLEDKLQAKSYANSALELATTTGQENMQLKIEDSLKQLLT